MERLREMSRVRRVGSLGINVKRMMYERIKVPTVMYGTETGFECQKKKDEMFEKYMWYDS